jgi:N-acetylmuramoyl-L-alanine amidase
VTLVWLASAMTLAACQTGGTAPPAADTRSAAAEATATPVPASPPPPLPAAPPSTTTPAPQTRVVVLDPGHNGGNAQHPEVINKQVPAGRGETKPCNTTGTATNAGFTEHAFTWDVAQRVGKALSAKGIRVVYTRDNDTGVGPCVNRRAAIGNEAVADAVVSIHADGSDSAGARGFHVAYSSPPVNAAQGQPSLSLAETLRDDLRSVGFPVSNYLGSDGLAPRDDLAGLNLSTRPAALIECGNMRNAAEAAQMTSPEGRQRYADAITVGILAYLTGFY